MKKTGFAKAIVRIIDPTIIRIGVNDLLFLNVFMYKHMYIPFYLSTTFVSVNNNNVAIMSRRKRIDFSCIFCYDSGTIANRRQRPRLIAGRVYYMGKEDVYVPQRLPQMDGGQAQLRCF